ncbi:hypothetical protein AAC387_Pa07g2429 [Persea americana]
MEEVEDEEGPLGEMKMKKPLLTKKLGGDAQTIRNDVARFLNERKEMRKKGRRRRRRRRGTLVILRGRAQQERGVYIFSVGELGMWVGSANWVGVFRISHESDMTNHVSAVSGMLF